MDVAGYVRDLKAHVEGRAFINQAELCRYVGCGKATARELLEGVPFLAIGNQKRYVIRDVAKALKERELTLYWSES